MNKPLMQPMLKQPTPMLTSWEERDDATLMAHIRDGSHQAFSVLVRRHTQRFYAVAYRFLRHRQNSEDIVQEAFIKLWEQPGLWQPDKQAKFTTWFYRVVVNLCLDRQKRKAPMQIAEDMDFADETPGQEDNLVSRETQKQLEQAIDALPERQKTALNLCFSEGVSNQEAADIMGLKLKALQSLLIRAKTTLKETFKE